MSFKAAFIARVKINEKILYYIKGKRKWDFFLSFSER